MIRLSSAILELPLDLYVSVIFAALASALLIPMGQAVMP
jgi:hypothetical protein